MECVRIRTDFLIVTIVVERFLTETELLSLPCLNLPCFAMLCFALLSSLLCCVAPHSLCILVLKQLARLALGLASPFCRPALFSLHLEKKKSDQSLNNSNWIISIILWAKLDHLAAVEIWHMYVYALLLFLSRLLFSVCYYYYCCCRCCQSWPWDWTARPLYLFWCSGWLSYSPANHGTALHWLEYSLRIFLSRRQVQV